MSRVRLRTEVIDFAAVRRQRADERAALARRIFALWQPIFSHLDDEDYTFHLKRHVEDQSAVQIRGIFGIDEEGRDRALMIVRVHEHVIAGRTWARLMVNAGSDTQVVQRYFGQSFLVREVWRYRLRYPLRPFFLVDNVVSAAGYCTYDKYFSGFAPTRERAIPDAWWALTEAGAKAMGGARVEGTRREVHRFVALVRDPSPRRPRSDRARAAARFYDEATGGAPDLGVLVMAPLSVWRWGHTCLQYGWARARGILWPEGRRG